ncbi:MAG TPA: hypothetical protein VGM43_19935 [Bryobacteraceae bacterium]|jgi:hypothetical protein
MIDSFRRKVVIVGSATAFAAWLFAIVLLASQNVFRTDVGSLGVPAVMLGALTGGGGIVFLTVLIPGYGVPRSFLIHSYSLIGLFRRSSHPAKQAEPTRYRLHPDTLVRDSA